MKHGFPRVSFAVLEIEVNDGILTTMLFREFHIFPNVKSIKVLSISTKGEKGLEHVEIQAFSKASWAENAAHFPAKRYEFFDKERLVDY
jgi:hypothetical protein